MRCAHPERLDTPRHLLNHPLDVLGAVQLAGLDIDTLQRPAQRVHRRLERIESLDGLGAPAPRARQFAFALAPALLVIRAYLAQPPQRLTLAFNRCIGAPLQTPACLVHLVEHMKTIIALLGVRKHLTHPRSNPTRRILHNHRQPQPLSLTLAKQLRPRLAIARWAQRQTEQIPPVEVHPGKHRLALAEHLIERPGLDPAQRDLRVEPRRASLGLDQHLLNRPVRHLHPGVEQRHQILNRAQRVGREHTQRHHRSAKLRIIDPHIHRRTLEQRRFKMAAKHRFRCRPNGVHRGPRNLIRLTQRRLRTVGVSVLSCHRRCGTLNLLGSRQVGALEYGHRLAPVDAESSSPRIISRAPPDDFPSHSLQRLSASAICKAE